MARRSSSGSSRMMNVFRRSSEFLFEVRNSVRNFFNGNTNNQSRNRTIIIDGVNVAQSFSNYGTFSVRGLEIAINFFENKGHRVKAVCPQNYTQRVKTDDQNGFHRLVKQRKVVLTPCKRLPSNTNCCTHKKLILDITHSKEGVIISNDNFRDLLNENEKWNEVIRSRILGYSWSNGTFNFDNSNVLFR